MSDTVLIIDNDRVFAGSLKRALEVQGRKTAVRPEGDIQCIMETRPAAVVISIERSGDSGLSLCGQLRRNRGLRHIPILLFVTKTTPETIRTHAEGPERADLYARKPLSIDHAVQLVQQLCRSTSSISASPKGRATSVQPPALPRASSLGPTASRRLPTGWPAGRFSDILRSLPPEIPGSTPTSETRQPSREELLKEMNAHGMQLSSRVAFLSEKLRSQQAHLDTLQQERDELEHQLTTTEDHFRSYHRDVEKVFAEKDAEEQELQKRLITAEKRVAHLDAVLTTKEKHTPTAQSLARLRTQLENAHRDHQNRADECTRLQTELHRTQETTQHQQDELTHLREQNHQQQDELDQLRTKSQGQLNEQEAAVTQLKVTCTHQENELDRLRETLAERERRLEEAHAEAQQHADQVEAWEARLNDLIAQSEAQYAALTKTYEQQLQQATACEARVRTLEKENAHQATAIDTLRAVVTDLNEQLESSASAHDQKTATLENELMEAHHELETAHELASEVRRAHRSTEDELTRARHALTEAQEQVIELKAVRESTQQEVSKTRSAMSVLQAEQARQEQTIGELEQACERWAQKYQQQEQQTSEVYGKLRRLEDDLEMYADKCHQAEEHAEQQGETIVELHAQLDNARAELQQTRRLSSSTRTSVTKTSISGPSTERSPSPGRLAQLIEKAEGQAVFNTPSTEPDRTSTPTTPRGRGSPGISVPPAGRIPSRGRPSTRSKRLMGNSLIASAGLPQSAPFVDEEEHQVTEVASLYELGE